MRERGEPRSRSISRHAPRQRPDPPLVSRHDGNRIAGLCPGQAFPGFGIESTADTIGTVVGVATLAGVAAHAVVTNIRKHQVIAEVHAEDLKES